VSTTTPADEVATLQEMISVLSEYDEDTRIRLLRTVQTFFGVEGDFSDHPEIPPKDFILEKRPRTDVERVVCLAYYLAHYRNKKHFRTLDVSKLNTEAAQPKFSNPSNAVASAMKCGYLAQASKVLRQLSAAGERFVLALPDREAARAAMKRMRPRRSTKPKAARKNSGETA
jgi:hypothetical protein